MQRQKCEELNDFVKYSLSRGISKDQVKELLKKNGWPDDTVKRMFASGNSSYSPVSAGGDALKIAGITKSYGKNVVLSNISLSIKPGEIFGVIGLSGSGKTTLLNTIVGFVQADTGDIIIKNQSGGKDYSVSRQHSSAKKMFGFASQHPSFYDKLTVEENVLHFASLYSISRKQRKEKCRALIKMVGLENAKKVLAQNLSGGMQKRLDIACALVHDPKILILDEPTSDLDPVSREYMWAVIKEINSKGTTIILASHFVNELEELCSRFAILHDRNIAEVGTPEELKSAYSRDYEIILETKSRKYDRISKEMKSKKSLDIQKTSTDSGVLTIYTSKPEQALYTLARLIESMDEKIIDISVNRPTIRELFEAVVKK